MMIRSLRTYAVLLGTCAFATAALPGTADAVQSSTSMPAETLLTSPVATYVAGRVAHRENRVLRFDRLVIRQAGFPTVRVKATAKTKKKLTTRYPTIRGVTPLKLTVGQQLKIIGHYFIPGKGKDTVVFQRTGSAAVFAKADSATSSLIKVTVPAKLSSFLSGASKGAPVATKFRIRVLAKRFSQSFTASRLSPTISPAAAAPVPAAQTCPVLAKANPNGDQDADGMSNALELKYGTDPCNPDTDGDGMTDGWEYDSALDLNGNAYPYAATEPWPNPLDPSDAGDDFDGDGLVASQEFTLWKFVSGKYPVTAYSDGTQNSGGAQPVANAQMATLDYDGDGNLEDDERDADGDGLSNIVESGLAGRIAFDTDQYSEPVYGLRHFGTISMTNPDSDGDGIPDGLDDQDNDGWNNFEEMQLDRQGTGLRVAAYNPCLPNPYALTCQRVLKVGQTWPPFDGSEPIADPNATPPVLGAAIPFTWPAGDKAAVSEGGWNGHGGPQGPGA